MDSKATVEQMLKNYHATQRSLEILKFKIERFAGVSYDEVIEALNMTRQEGEKVQDNNLADKTAKIALIFREIADSENGELLRELVRQYYQQKSELDVLEYCISMLPPRIADVINDLFIAGLSWAEMCNKYSVSWAMIGRYRKMGLEEIARLYDAKKVG